MNLLYQISSFSPELIAILFNFCAQESVLHAPRLGTMKLPNMIHKVYCETCNVSGFQCGKGSGKCISRSEQEKTGK